MNHRSLNIVSQERPEDSKNLEKNNIKEDEIYGNDILVDEQIKINKN